MKMGHYDDCYESDDESHRESMRKEAVESISKKLTDKKLYDYKDLQLIDFFFDNIRIIHAFLGMLNEMPKCEYQGKLYSLDEARVLVAREMAEKV